MRLDTEMSDHVPDHVLLGNSYIWLCLRSSQSDEIKSSCDKEDSGDVISNHVQTMHQYLSKSQHSIVADNMDLQVWSGSEVPKVSSCFAQKESSLKNSGGRPPPPFNTDPPGSFCSLTWEYLT